MSEQPTKCPARNQTLDLGCDREAGHPDDLHWQYEGTAIHAWGSDLGYGR